MFTQGKKLLITDTILRDAHQSLIATRMRTRDMLPICEKLDKVGYFSLEVWGGATFDVCIRFLNEDPWERLRLLREALPNTKLQMLLRGQNLVGYRHYADDVVEKFIKLTKKNGLDIFRIFDALNDIRNMEYPIKVAKDVGGIVQGTLSYTVSPVHTIESYVEIAGKLEALGCDYICIKDMAGVISPKSAYDLVSALKKNISVPIVLHTHCTSGMGPASCLAAIFAGVDIIDTAISPFAWGTSQPPTESIVAMLKDTPYDTQLDLDLLVEIGAYFLNVKEKYKALLSPFGQQPDVTVLSHQVPGGMLSNFYSQLKEQNAVDKYPQLLKEIPKVRKDLGYPPLVTPTSQIVGTQAVINVLEGKPYQRVTQEVKDYCLGYYGKPPASIDPKVLEIVIGDEKPISCRPADLLEPELPKLEEEAKKLGILKKEEDLITYALYPKIAPKFLSGELKEEEIPHIQEPQKVPVQEIQKAPVGLYPAEFEVEVEDEIFRVKVTPIHAEGEEAVKETKVGKRPKNIPEGAVLAPMTGVIVSLKVKEGTEVKKGEGLAVLEAMKMQNEITAPHDGKVTSIFTYVGESVTSGDILLVIGK